MNNCQRYIFCCSNSDDDDEDDGVFLSYLLLRVVLAVSCAAYVSELLRHPQQCALCSERACSNEYGLWKQYELKQSAAAATRY